MVKKILGIIATAMTASLSMATTLALNPQEDVEGFEAGLTIIKPKMAAMSLLATSSISPIYATGDIDVTRYRGQTIYLYFEVPSSVTDISSATVSLNAYDVDTWSTEHDKVYFNDKYVGSLQGYNNDWESNTFHIPSYLVKIGSNTMRIHVDVDELGWVTRVNDIKLILNGTEGKVTLSASTDQLNKIVLNWSSNISGATYNIYRGTSEDNLELFVEKTTATTYDDTAIVDGQNYYYQIMTISGVSSPIRTGSCHVPVVTLKEPSNDLYHKIKLDWSASYCTGPYTIYRGTTLEELADTTKRTQVALDVTGTSYTDTSVEAGEKYYYQVQAADGTMSNEDKGVSLFKLEATNDKYNKVILSWTGDPESGVYYYVFRSTNQEALEDCDVDTLFCIRENLSDTEFTDGTLWFEPGTRYYYRVLKSNGVKSNIAEGNSKVGEIKLYATKNLSGLVQLSWSSSIDNSQYEIFRKRRNTLEEFSRLGMVSFKFSYPDRDCEAGVEYEYQIRSVRADWYSNLEIGRCGNVIEPAISAATVRNYARHNGNQVSRIASCDLVERDWVSISLQMNAFSEDLFEIVGAAVYGEPVSNYTPTDRAWHFMEWNVPQSDAEIGSLKGFKECASSSFVESHVSPGTGIATGYNSSSRLVTLYGQLSSGADNRNGAHGKYKWHFICFYKNKEGESSALPVKCSYKNTDVILPVYFNACEKDHTWNIAEGIDENGNVKIRRGPVPNWLYYWMNDHASDSLEYDTIAKHGHDIVYGGNAGRYARSIPKKRQIIVYDGAYSTTDINWGRISNGNKIHSFGKNRGVHAMETIMRRENIRLARYDAYHSSWNHKAKWNRSVIADVPCDCGKSIIHYLPENVPEESLYDSTDSDAQGFYWDENDDSRILVIWTNLKNFIKELLYNKGWSDVELRSDYLTNEDESHWYSDYGFDKTKRDTYNFVGSDLYIGTDCDHYCGDLEVFCRAEEFAHRELGNEKEDWSYPRINYGNMSALASTKSQLAGEEILTSNSSDEERPCLEFISAHYCQSSDSIISNIVYEMTVVSSGDLQYNLVGYLTDNYSNVLATATCLISNGTNNVYFTFHSDDMVLKQTGIYHFDKIAVWKYGQLSPCCLGFISGFDLHSGFIDANALFSSSGKVLSSVSLNTRPEGGFNIACEAEIAVAGNYVARATICSTNLEFVGTFDATNTCQVGTNAFEIVCDNLNIAKSGVEGPYVVESLALLHNGEEVSFTTVSEDNNEIMADACLDNGQIRVSNESLELTIGTKGSLKLCFKVLNETGEDISYYVSTSLFGTNSLLVLSSYDSLQCFTSGVNFVEVEFPSSCIRNSNVDGPYWIDGLRLVPESGCGDPIEVRPSVQTLAYKSSDFIGDAVSFTDSHPQLVDAYESDALTVSVDYQANYPCTVVAAATLIDTNGNFVVRAYTTNVVTEAGLQMAEITFQYSAVKDALAEGPFKIGYFSLTPQIDGEEALYLDSFAIENVQPTYWEAMFDWDVVDGNAYAVRYNGTNENVRVPAVAQGCPVVGIGECAFFGCTNVLTAIIADGIEEIGIGAFFDTSITNQIIPASISQIGNAAFNIETLRTVMFMGEPPTCGNDAFAYGAIGYYLAENASAWQAVLGAGAYWKGLIMLPEGIEPSDYTPETGWQLYAGTDAVAHDGKNGFQSAPIANGESTAMTVTMDESGTVSFWWRTSCEDNDTAGDHAEFLVDGTVVATSAGETGWTLVSYELTGGTSHELTWRYQKDQKGSVGSDCVWVSDIKCETIAGQVAVDKLDDESEYNWFYEENPASVGEENFEYVPSETPEEAICQIDVVAGIMELPLTSKDEHDISNMQGGLFKVADLTGLNYAALAKGGWILLGNERINVEEGDEARYTIMIDYGKNPATIRYLVSGLSLTNAEGVSEFVCNVQKERVSEIIAADGGNITALAGKYEVRNSDLQCATNGEEVTYSGDIASSTNGTLHVAGGGTLVIPGESIPNGGVKRKVHIDANSRIKFDFMHLTTIPTVLNLFNGVGVGFVPGDRIKIAVPGEGVDRISKVFNKNGNLEARIAERPTMENSSPTESPFSVVSDGDTSTATTSIGNAVEGFWYGLETTETLNVDFSLDADSVKQCTSTGSMTLESSANANSDSGFYRVSVSAEEP